MAWKTTQPSSTCINTIAYNDETNECQILFHKGTPMIYTIPNLPEEVYEEWISSGSVGSFFNANIRGQY
jgi:hypothetical protein